MIVIVYKNNNNMIITINREYIIVTIITIDRDNIQMSYRKLTNIITSYNNLQKVNSIIK